MEDGKEKDPNQSSCKMDGAERYGEEEGKEEGRHSIGVEVLRGMQEEGRSVPKGKVDLGFGKVVGVKMGGGPVCFGAPLPSGVSGAVRAWHCTVPRCGLPNEPSEARPYLGSGESHRLPFPRWVQPG